MLNTLCKVCAEARKTITAWLALAIAGLAQAAEHVEDAYNTFPQLEQYLPKSAYVHTGIHYVMTVLGIAVVVTRVRRIVWPPKG